MNDFVFTTDPELCHCVGQNITLNILPAILDWFCHVCQLVYKNKQYGYVGRRQRPLGLTHRTLGDVAIFSKSQIQTRRSECNLEKFLWICSQPNADGLRWWQNQHCSRQQAITWANIDPYLCRHMTSPGHNELIRQKITLWCSFVTPW